MGAVADTIRVIHAWHRSRAPDRRWVNSPATDEQIEAAEEELGVPLPQDLRELYSTYNGSSIAIGGYGTNLQSLDEVIQSRELWRELQAEDPSYAWWESTWIPIANNTRHYNCVDPVTGEVISLWVDDEPPSVVAPCVSVWLSRFSEALERDEYVYDPVDEWVVRVAGQ